MADRVRRPDGTYVGEPGSGNTLQGSQNAVQNPNYNPQQQANVNFNAPAAGRVGVVSGQQAPQIQVVSTPFLNNLLAQSQQAANSSLLGSLLQPSSLFNSIQAPNLPKVQTLQMGKEQDPFKFIIDAGYDPVQFVKASILQQQLRDKNVNKETGRRWGEANVVSTIYSDTPEGQAAKKAAEDAAKQQPDQSADIQKRAEQELERAARTYIEKIKQGGNGKQAMQEANNALSDGAKQVLATQAQYNEQRFNENMQPKPGLLQRAVGGVVSDPLSLFAPVAYGKMAGNALAAWLNAKDANKESQAARDRGDVLYQQAVAARNAGSQKDFKYLLQQAQQEYARAQGYAQSGQDAAGSVRTSDVLLNSAFMAASAVGGFGASTVANIANRGAAKAIAASATKEVAQAATKTAVPKTVKTVEDAAILGESLAQPGVVLTGKKMSSALNRVLGKDVTIKGVREPLLTEDTVISRGLNSEKFRAFINAYSDAKIAQQLADREAKMQAYKAGVLNAGLTMKDGDLLSRYVVRGKEGTTKFTARAESKTQKDLISGLSPEKRVALRKAANFHRKFFEDELARVNAARKAQKHPGDEIKPKEFYATAFRKKNIIQRIFGKADNTYNDSGNPAGGSSVFFSKRQSGKYEPADAFQGAEAYINASTSAIHLGDVATVYDKLLANKAVKKALKESKSSNKRLLASIENQINEYRGVPGGKISAGGNQIQLAQNGPLAELSGHLSSKASRAVVGGSLSSLFAQGIALPQKALQHPATFVKSIANKEALTELKRSAFRAERFQDPQHLSKNAWRSAVEKSYVPLKTTERAAFDRAWKTEYVAQRGKGLTQAQARLATDLEMKRLVASRAVGQRPAIFRSKTLSPFTAFTLESANNLSYLSELARKGRYKDLAASLAGLEAYNQIVSPLLGYSPGFSPYNTGKDMYTDIKQGNPLAAGGRLAGEVLSQVPLGGALAQIASDYAARKTGKTADQMSREIFGSSQVGRFGSVSPITSLFTGNEKAGQPGVQDPFKWAAKWLLPAGGNQAIKTKEGIQAVLRGTIKNKTGEIPVEQTPANLIRAALLGPYATAEGRQWSKDISQGNTTQKQDAVSALLGQYQGGLQSGRAYGPTIELSDKEKSVLAGIAFDRNGNPLSNDKVNKNISALPPEQQLLAKAVRDKYSLILNSPTKTAETERKAEQGKATPEDVAAAKVEDQTDPVVVRLSKYSNSKLEELARQDSKYRDMIMATTNYEIARGQAKGELSQVDAFNKLLGAQKSQVKSQFSADAVDFAGLSKSNKLKFLSQYGGDKQALVDQANAYKQTLASLGLTSVSGYKGYGKRKKGKTKKSTIKVRKVSTGKILKIKKPKKTKTFLSTLLS